MPSITSWTRLETDSGDAEMRATLGARIFNPLWMLTRQWQVGEFQAEDAGTPVIARVRATNALLSRCHVGELRPHTAIEAPRYDPHETPLEMIVERRRMRPRSEDETRLLRFAVEAGLHFLRMLDLQSLSRNYRKAFTARFALQQPPPAQIDVLDEATARFVQTMAGRAPDGRLLEKTFRDEGPARVTADDALGIARSDRAEIELTASRWLEWYDSVFAEPSNGEADAWIPSRLEYAVSVSGRLSERPEDERTLTALEYDGGTLDWSSFDLNAEVNMGTAPDRRFRTITDTTIPAPVTFPGAPSPRFWELEDARIDYGLMPVGPTDLAQLLMIEYASSYGNDWFVIPLTLPIGSLTSIDSLVVVDTFGVRTLLRPIGDPALQRPSWSMWQLAFTRSAGADTVPRLHSNLFFLPPSLARTLESTPIEDVLFMRDEMANVAWAIERRLESPIEQALRRDDPASTAGAGEPVPAGGPMALPPRYVLSTTVPAHWIPLVPVQLMIAPGKIESRLKRAAVLQPDGLVSAPPPAQGDVLSAAGDLLLYDEEIPREGVRVERRRELARWIDGSTWVWTAHRKYIGRGEGSSGLRYNRLET